MWVDFQDWLIQTSDGCQDSEFPNGSKAFEARCFEGENDDLARNAKLVEFRSLSLDNRDCVGYLSRETDLDSFHDHLKILCRRLGSIRFKIRNPY